MIAVDDFDRAAKTVSSNSGTAQTCNPLFFKLHSTNEVLVCNVHITRNNVYHR